MTTTAAKFKGKLLLPILLGVLVFSAACNNTGGAAKIITEKAKEQTKKITLGKVISVADCLTNIDAVAVEPTFSDHIAEKTELISSW